MLVCYIVLLIEFTYLLTDPLFIGLFYWVRIIHNKYQIVIGSEVLIIIIYSVIIIRIYGKIITCSHHKLYLTNNFILYQNVLGAEYY